MDAGCWRDKDLGPQGAYILVGDVKTAVVPGAFPRSPHTLGDEPGTCRVMRFGSSQPRGLQHARPPCPSPSPRVCPSMFCS